MPWVRELLDTHEHPVFVGVSGSQGSGKSTLCRQLCEAVAAEGGHAVTISIDDLYLTRAQRQALAATVHPLCALRGLPGTHDVALGLRLFEALRHAGPEDLTAVPRFDKSIDDRAPQPDTVVGRPDLVLFEGWCLLASPGPAWRGPINAREARDDPHGDFVRWSEAALASDYPALWAQLDASVFLAMPSFEAVVEGRWRQEAELAARHPGAPGVMTRAEVEDYVALFERKTRQLLAELPAVADRTLPAWISPR
ncbi:MAG: kinase [Deltaproteobacteria bacterium]|nr:MAG: kinase [Deltaproteobacteria bacterium]